MKDILDGTISPWIWFPAMIAGWVVGGFVGQWIGDRAKAYYARKTFEKKLAKNPHYVPGGASLKYPATLEVRAKRKDVR